MFSRLHAVFSAFSSLVVTVEAGLMFLELNASSPSDYSKLMNNQHVIMIGDSLMRYQFLSLVYLLHTDSFLSVNERPNILIVGSYNKSRDAFYNSVRQTLAPENYCDCLAGHYENHYYTNKERNISISYIGYAGFARSSQGGWMPTEQEPYPIHGHSATYNEIRWKYDTIEECFTEFAIRLHPRPTTLVLNAGHWASDLNETTRIDSVLSSALKNFDRVFWKTTNYNQQHEPGDYAHDSICHFPSIECLNLEWTKHLDSSHYTDRLHFMPDVYHDINTQFIYQLRTHRALKIAPLGAAYYNNIIIYKNKHYIVGGKGMLRPFTLPLENEENSDCLKKIAARKHIRMPWGKLITHVLGEPLDDICSFIHSKV